METPHVAVVTWEVEPGALFTFDDFDDVIISLSNYGFTSIGRSCSFIRPFLWLLKNSEGKEKTLKLLCLKNNFCCGKQARLAYVVGLLKFLLAKLNENLEILGRWLC